MNVKTKRLFKFQEDEYNQSEHNVGCFQDAILTSFEPYLV